MQEGYWKSQRKTVVEKLLIPIGLFILSFYDYDRGIDLTDAGYSLHFYQFFDEYEGTNIIPRFWSILLGHVICGLPYGDTWKGVSFYCTFIIAFCAVTAYYFAKKYVGYKTAALCEVFALFFCWNPNVILYDYLSFFLFQLGIIFVFEGIEKDKAKWYIAAGFCLGINVFVRIPNIAQCATIILVWISGLARKKKFTKIVTDTLYCIMGYIVGISISLVAILAFYNISDLHLALWRLAHASNSLKNYSIWYMATATIIEVFKFCKYVVALLLVACIASAIIFRLNNKKAKLIFEITVCLFVIVIFAYWSKKNGLMHLDYKWLNSVSKIASIFLLWALIASIWNFFEIKSVENKLLALTYLGVFWVTPLGSNNYIYLEIMNMFLTIPLGVYQIKTWGENRVLRKLLGDSFKKVYRSMIITVASIMGLQIFVWGILYTYKDECECIVVSESKVNGMKTSLERKNELEQLEEYFQEEHLYGSYGILYCNSPGLGYVLDIKPVMSSSWPDWYTYTYDDFFAGIQNAEQLVKTDNSPVVILSNAYSYSFEDIDNDHWEVVKDDKYFRLFEFLTDNKYECTYRTKNYSIYLRKEN